MKVVDEENARLNEHAHAALLLSEGSRTRTYRDIRMVIAKWQRGMLIGLISNILQTWRHHVYSRRRRTLVQSTCHRWLAGKELAFRRSYFAAWAASAQHAAEHASILEDYVARDSIRHQEELHIRERLGLQRQQ